jgi:hypothetical protein
LQKLQKGNIAPFVKKTIFKGKGIKMNHSENLESTYSPLSGGDRVKVISFFTLLILPFLSVPVILIIGIAIYIMKKDKSFSPILKSKNWIKLYLILLGILLISGVRDNHDFSDIVMGILCLIFLWSLLFIFDFLFFKPLEEHQDWVVKNGIFADKEKTIDREKNNSNPCSVADELLKWNDLLEKGLITEEEFEKQKKKILNK